jgi:hypothetical protein
MLNTIFSLSLSLCVKWTALFRLTACYSNHHSESPVFRLHCGLKTSKATICRTLLVFVTVCWRLLPAALLYITAARIQHHWIAQWDRTVQYPLKHNYNVQIQSDVAYVKLFSGRTYSFFGMYINGGYADVTYMEDPNLGNCLGKFYCLIPIF